MASANRYRRIARQKARKYGIDEDIFERQINAESGFNPNLTSSAGAQGIAQIMPGTAKAWKVDPWDPVAALDAAARNMAKYRRQYGSYRNALIAYNAGPARVGKPLYSETRNYINKILTNGEPKSQPTPAGRTPEDTLDGGGAPTIQFPEQAPPPPPPVSAPPPPAFNAREYLASPVSGEVPQLAQTNFAPPQVQVPEMSVAPPKLSSSDMDSQTGGAPQGGPGQPSMGGSGMGKVIVPGGANRAGTPLRKPIMNLTGRAAGILGKPIKVGTGTNHSKMTSTGNVSDHWDGNAVDVPATGKQGDAIAAAFLMAAGVSEKRAWAMARKGGVFNVTHRGRRLQLLWKTNVGGNHYNHIHAGYR